MAKALSKAAQATSQARLQRDRAAYHKLLELAVTHGKGYKSSAEAVGCATVTARRCFEKGIPEDGLKPIRVMVAAARTKATVGADTVKDTQVAVRATARAAAQEAAQEVSAELRAAAMDIAKAEAELFKAGAKSLKEESQLVDSTRRTATIMLGRLIRILRASEPMFAKLEELVADTDLLDTKSGLAQLQQLMTLGNQIIGMGDKAMQLRRRLMGDPERIMAMHGSKSEFESDEEALAALQVVARQLGEAQELGLTLIEGGKAS